ncbi:hypothetical protein RDWZM_001488 [Blomia tropicalis]|uniref:USP domain-containing protein n=1 Tax=Blomia tropicalis TaxID=40697 RepID=A0A9Q0MD58_BLOTA|nr:hypothetical protein RDWZM_001488 [Blomia tropicalis]
MLLTELRTDDDWGMGNNVAVQYKVRNALPGMKLARDWRLCLAIYGELKLRNYENKENADCSHKSLTESISNQIQLHSVNETNGFDQTQDIEPIPKIVMRETNANAQPNAQSVDNFVQSSVFETPTKDNIVNNIPKPNEQELEYFPILNCFVNLYRKIEDATTINEIEQFLRDFKSQITQKQMFQQFIGEEQQDSGEFCSVILQALNDEIEEFCSDNELKLENPVSRYFQFKFREESSCSKCKKVKTIENYMTGLHLTIPNDRTLQSAINRYLTETDPCPKCSINMVTKRYFTNLPKVLYLQTGRHSYNLLDKDTEKVLFACNILLPNDNIKLQKDYSLTPIATPYKASLKRAMFSDGEKKSFVKKLKFGEEESDGTNNDHYGTTTNESDIIQERITILSPSMNSQENAGEKYQLVSIICHIGESLKSGHFISYVFNFEHSKWFKCNDEKIIEVSFSTIQEDAAETSLCYFYVHVND